MTAGTLLIGTNSVDSPGMGPGSLSAGNPLAQLAATALMPVLHLSLHVREIDSRWRMGQLLCRLLSRLGTAPHLLGPHLPALTQWVPTAWLACDGEQLLQEATVDAAITLLQAVDEAPHGLVSACLELVSVATSWGAPDAAGGGAAGSSPEHATSRGGGGGEPPVGLVEISMRLWRACLSAIRPPLQGEPLAPQLLPLVGRLPALLELGDEMARPSMLLLDWYFLSDRLERSCGGGLAQAAPTSAPFFASLSAVFERAITCGGRGTLAAVGAMHTLLLVYPEQV